MFLRKQFAFLNEEAVSRGISLEDLVRALGPRGMNLGVRTDPLCASPVLWYSLPLVLANRRPIQDIISPFRHFYDRCRLLAVAPFQLGGRRPFAFLVQVNDEELRLLVKEMDTNDDGNVSLKEFATFVNLDDHEPLYQPLFDGRRRNVNILQVQVEAWKKQHLHEVGSCA